MLIRSQDKTAIANFDAGCTGDYYCQPEGTGTIRVFTNTYTAKDSYIHLGTYKDQDRTREVFDQLTREICTSHPDGYYFQMPEE